MKENQNNGCYKNLENQLNAIMRNTNELSMKSRYRYLAAMKRCMEYTASHFGLMKVKNFSSKHLVSYVNYMKDEKKLSAGMIKTEIAGIRYFHKHSGSKNELIPNSKLDLTPRRYGVVNRIWLPQEVEGAIKCGLSYSRMDFVLAVKFSLYFSLRLEECCNLRVNSLQKCNEFDSLEVKGKGGKIRYVQMTTPEQRALVQEALKYAAKNNLSKTDRLITDNRRGSVEKEKKSIENFLSSKKHLFMESDRKKYVVGNKVLSETITMHGLRATYAQNLYNELKEKNPHLSEREIILRVSSSLGHNRCEISRIYLG